MEQFIFRINVYNMVEDQKHTFLFVLKGKLLKPKIVEKCQKFIAIIRWGMRRIRGEAENVQHSLRKGKMWGLIIFILIRTQSSQSFHSAWLIFEHMKNVEMEQSK